jgi:heme/copper-type cytochrome/quinol oxidase subunit 3
MSAIALSDRQGHAASAGMWLFIASIVMFYGALFSGYVLLRAGSTVWETPWRTGLAAEWPIAVDHWFRTMWLAFAVMQARRLAGEGVPIAGQRRFSLLVGLAGAAFVWRCIHVAGWLASQGFVPATSVPLACWYVLTGAVALLVAGGTVAAVWVAIERVPAAQRARRGAMLQRYWLLMFVVWVATVGGLYLV